MAYERLGPYRIDRRIGRGGMGTVFSATTDVTGEVVAVKVLTSPGGNEEGITDRFAAEIESLRLLRHPNIVRILGYGEDDGCRYYAMELIQGKSLQDAMDEGRKFDWPEAVRYAMQICLALKHAHDRGIVHRDIKPANLLLARDGCIKLSDFGIAKSFGNVGMTAEGGVIGTAEYMSPEQADGRPATHRSDLYSLGGVLYALLAGRPPFKARNFIEMLKLQRHAEPDSVLRFNANVPKALNALVLQLLDKDPAKRMPNAMMTSRALEAVLAATGSAASREANVSEDGATGSSIHGAAQVLPIDDAPTDVLIVAEAKLEPPRAKEPIAGSMATAAEPEPVKPKMAASSSPARPMSFATRTFTPIDRDDPVRLVSPEEIAPAWVRPQTWALVAAMLIVGLAVWYWLQPPSSEKLYARIKEAAQQDKVERLVDVERDIHSFLEYYSFDRRARELQSYLDEIDLYRLERKFEFRGKFLAKNDGLGPVERAYLEAISYVHLDPAVGRKKMQALLDLYRDMPDASKPARECLLLAQKQLERLDRLAAAAEVDARQLIEKQLAKAEALHADNPAAAERLRKAVIELYGNEPWAAELVDRARNPGERLGGTP